MESYDCDNLPVELEKYYSLAFKFVQAVRGKVKKVLLTLSLIRSTQLTNKLTYTDYNIHKTSFSFNKTNYLF